MDLYMAMFLAWASLFKDFITHIAWLYNDVCYIWLLSPSDGMDFHGIDPKVTGLFFLKFTSKYNVYL